MFKVLFVMIALAAMMPAAQAQQSTSDTLPLPARLRQMAQDQATTATTTTLHARQGLENYKGRLYTSRPLLAVGILESIDLENQVLNLKLDAQRSCLPVRLKSMAEKSGRLQEVLDQEFPPQRSFKLNRHTMVLDGRASGQKEQTKASTGDIRNDKQRLELSDLCTSDTVTVLFSLPPRDGMEARVLNVSKIDPDQQGLSADFSPLRGRKVKMKLPAQQESPSTGATQTTVPAAP